MKKKLLTIILLTGLFLSSINGQSNLSFTAKGVPFKMIYVQGGTYTMGGIYDPLLSWYIAHTVTVSDFYIGETEVTQALWKAVMGTTIYQQRDKAGSDNSLYGTGDNYPMYYVSYTEATEFCVLLNHLLRDQLPSGYRFSLPTEAEWEYAARGGKNKSNCKHAGSNSLQEVGWSDGQRHPVKTKSPNALGIYDMTGNVDEWCADWNDEYYYHHSPQNNPKGPSSGTERVVRGGSYNQYDVRARISVRPDHRGRGRGFRIALVRQ